MSAPFQEQVQVSEKEDGEIDDTFELSDISSEEEYLLRQRLTILENYNYALERKEAKRLSFSSSNTVVKVNDGTLSDISLSDIEEHTFHYYTSNHRIKQRKHHRKHRHKTESRHKLRNSKQKPSQEVSNDSDSTDYEYRNKRRKLQEAVKITKNEKDKTSLKDRLSNMLFREQKQMSETLDKPVKVIVETIEQKYDDSSLENNENSKNIVNNINLSTILPAEVSSDTIDGKVKPDNDSSDVDLEELRQSALNTKKVKETIIEPESKDSHNNSDEDSDTNELRLICLKSSLLKKAIEIKQKQKMRKKLSNVKKNSNKDSVLTDIEYESTDIESVDMDIGFSDTPDENILYEHFDKNDVKRKDTEELDEIDEDEDLLRAKLLTSLNNNLQNVNKFTAQNSDVTIKNREQEINSKKLIIRLNDSDSSDHEATKNLTKMHAKLEEVTFQQRLDLLLKNARTHSLKKQEVDVADNINTKFVPKSVKHLPLSDQIEYQKLVKRMEELEKVKKQRQLLINKTAAVNEQKINSVTNSKQNNIEDSIKLSRQKIAEESSRVLKLKEEGNKLFIQYKQALKEFQNLQMALRVNKRELKQAQNLLAMRRNQHNLLIQMTQTSRRKVVHNYHGRVNSNLFSVTVKNDIKSDKQQKTNELSLGMSNSATMKMDVKNFDKSGDNCNDYDSPLADAKGYNLDPNGILCPFDLMGTCRDNNCKFLHPKT